MHTDPVIDSQPPAAALTWAAEVAGPEASARTVRRLLGGTHAATHLLETVDPAHEMILHRYPPGDRAAARAAVVLAALDGLGGWAPRLLGADPEGERFGEPATLITRLPGRSDITPASPEVAAVQLGRTLARLHEVPLHELTGLRDGMATIKDAASAHAAASSDPGTGTAPAPAPAPAPASAILASHGHRLTEEAPVLTHYDYWSGNVLWQGDRLTGVIDWSGASLAPRGFDVSWCRLDLVLLHGPAAAETFLAAYEEAAGQDLPAMVLWDLFALTNSLHSVETWYPNYQDLGRTDLTPAELRTRHTAWTDDRLAHYRALPSSGRI
ncbi:aminoglycoside phosphotransferase family protein [Streptomyces sp. NBC_00669]|uniref:phosphotransferase family protein n=1 Tax=Streptomyces sp. NBC_00669 TaxID=2976011 RepID=UPI002E341A03|nr:aminoglycoside phosphotransferase family protein [Streptomyces sp. NBC_00669]